MKTTQGAVLAIAVALLAVVTSACAAAPSRYRFDVAGPSSPTGTTVRLVDTSTGQPVTNAEVFAVTTVPAGNPHAIPPYTEMRAPLRPDGRGGYVYEARNVGRGQLLSLGARVGGQEVRGTVRVGG